MGSSKRQKSAAAEDKSAAADDKAAPNERDKDEASPSKVSTTKNASGGSDADDFVPVKRKRDRTVRLQNRSNRSEKNWTTAMKRHWNTKQKDTAMAQITIKRDQLQEVFTHHISLPR
jgi:hypothetical protein